MKRHSVVLNTGGWGRAMMIVVGEGTTKMTTPRRSQGDTMGSEEGKVPAVNRGRFGDSEVSGEER
jgi:hypothetical protein